MHISGRGQPCSLQRAILYHPMWTPDTIRWIHGNHPSAMNASDIDQDLGQSNAYQKHGVPFCIQAERKALQRKLEALQSEQKLHKLMFDPRAAKGCGRPSKPYQNSNEHLEVNTSNGHLGFKFSKSDDVPTSPSGDCWTSEEE